MAISSKINSIPQKRFIYILIFFLYAVPLTIFLVFIQNRVSTIYQDSFNNELVNFAQDIDDVVDVSKVLQTSLNEELNKEDRQVFPFSLKNAYVIIRNSELRPLAFNDSEKVPNLVKEMSLEEFKLLQNEGTGAYRIERISRNNEQYFQINYYSNDKFGKKYLIQILVPATFLEKENEKLIRDIIVWIPIFLIVVVTVSFLLFNLYLSPIKKINENLLDAKIRNNDIEIPKGLPDVIIKFLENINRVLSKERESSKDQKLFVAYASHELKTPLTVIKGVTDSLIKKEDRSLVRQDLLDISESISEIQLLIEKLMDLASLNQEIKISADEVDLLDNVMNSLDSYSNLIENNKLTINIKNEDDLSPIVKTDLKLAKLLIDNLIQNAIKYSKVGQSLIISISKSGQGNQTKIVIDNYSDPIPVGEIELITRPFYRISNAVDKDGAGLGLTIVNRISELLKINFQIMNIPNKVRVEVIFSH